MEGLVYAFRCGHCSESHDPGVTCHQAVLIRHGRCPECALVHGSRTCREARDILSRFTAAPPGDDLAPAAHGPRQP